MRSNRMRSIHMHTVKHVKQCERCLRFKALPDKAPMENVDATYPMKLVHMD